MAAKKGVYTLANISKEKEEERRRKISVYWKGQKKSEDHIEKIRLALKNHPKLIGRNPNNGSFKKGVNPWNKGLEHFKVKGANNPNWKGGISSEYDKARARRFLFKEWRNAVLKRDESKCQICSCDDVTKLVAHHKMDFIEYPELRYDIDNGQTLCRSCHTALHAYLRKNYEF